MQGTQTQPVPLAMPPQSPPKLRHLWQRAHILWFGSPSLGRRTNACQPIRHFQDLSMIKSAPPGRDRPDAQAWATSGTLASWRPSEPLPARDSRASWTHGQRSHADRRRGLRAHARTLLLFDAGRTTGARRKPPCRTTSRSRLACGDRRVHVRARRLSGVLPAVPAVSVAVRPFWRPSWRAERGSHRAGSTVSA